ncbi:ABC-type nitrate/sulfonate/bicarbonate transport system permease component [Natronocella acetinitrilica]|uniref:ABC-type nitrate/sulfonate/bicarbonate transport system permease component n=1 Tax=Natronocella acetinitrilica TaxID=414046 RepID=A0AAE3G0T2_9GAMM|nr:ABC transporter permease [Natronocella acetinitrilica]MCP1673660.1 ABC-type nitrate/sulfonate/bicarbonate transport system permease component [Natronocella acetinitrilica]
MAQSITDATRNAPRSNPLLRGVINTLLFLRRLTLLITLILVWEVVAGHLLTGHTALLMPAPSEIVTAAWNLISSGRLLDHSLASLKRVGVALLYASIAIPIGIAVGWSRIIYEQMNPLIEILRPIPPLAWIPLSILWFGIGDGQNQFIIFLGIFFPLLLNTIAGVASIETNLIRAARCLGASEAKVLLRVVLNAALPHIVTGMRVGIGVGWMALVAAEIVGATSGLGFLINDARTLLRTDIIAVGMLTIGIIGLLIDLVVRTLSDIFLPWVQQRADD